MLSNVASLSSEPYGTTLLTDDDDTQPNSSNSEAEAKVAAAAAAAAASEKRERVPPVDRVVKVYENHEDSVYGVEWSAVEPWIFASLSYDGRLVLNKVPKEEKFKILL